MSNLTLAEIKKIQFKKEESRIKIYQSIYEKCIKRIRYFLDKNLSVCYFDVPTFIIGMPLYDIRACICYIIIKIRKANIAISYFYPNRLYINWENQYLKNRKSKEKQFLAIEYQKTKKVLPLDSLQNFINHTTDIFKN